MRLVTTTGVFHKHIPIKYIIDNLSAIGFKKLDLSIPCRTENDFFLRNGKMGT